MNIRNRCLRWIALITTVLVVGVPGSAAATTVANQSLAVPVFQSPSKNSFWKDVTGAAANVPFVVANTGSGPGTKADPAYLTAINNATTAGIHTLGYVQTNFQQRPFQSSLSDADAWYRLYPNTKGIYIDLVQEGSADDVCYVAALYSHLKNTHPNDLVVLNPAGHLSPAYEPYGDIFVNAATDFGTYQNWRVQYTGFEDNPAYQNRFWHIVYGVTQDNYTAAFTDARNNNAGWVYITDQNMPTPFAATPSYWQNESSDINALPASSFPNRGKTTLPRGCISLSDSADSTIDTRTAKQTTVTSAITVNNTSTTYNSEPTTKLSFISVPKGVNVTSLQGANWACDVAGKACTYNTTLNAATSTNLTTMLAASCDYDTGSVTARLTNYAGNQWDLTIPVQPPVGCDASTAAGKINPKGTGQVTTLTTQSKETTPAIPAPTAAAQTTKKQQTAPSSRTRLSLPHLIAIIVIVLDLLFLLIWGSWRLIKRHRDPYRIR